MATYVNNLRLKEIATGDESGTWGTSTNTNLELITDGFSYGTKEMAADANETFTMPDATADATRSLYLKFTSAVDLTATREITLGPNTVSKTWIIENATTGGQIITIKQGSGATVNVPNGSKVMVVTDGAGAGAAVFNANPTEIGGTVTSVGGTGTVQGLTLSGTVTTSGDLTLGGSLADIDLTSQVTGTLPIANGGTGSTSTTYVDLTTNVTGTLPIANGGTGSTTASGALTNLGLTATAAELNTLDGITATTTELNYTDGVTSNIQTQLNAKGVGSVTSVAVSGGTTGLTTSGGPLTSSGTITIAGTLAVANGGTGVTSSTGSGSVVLSTSPTLATPNLGTPSAATLTNATGLPIVAGTTGTLSVARGGTGSTTASGALTNLGLTATAAEINTLDGITATTTELNYTDGVTSNIQTQLNAKGVGSVTSVGGTGTVSGITLSGTVTSSGNLTLGGSVSINNSNWSGTDLSLANGGTGASLVDPNADRIFFWDDSAGATTFLTVGSGLQISGTTLENTQSGGSVTSVAGTGTVNGLTMSGTVTTSGSLTLGGTLAINNSDWSGTDLSLANGGTGASLVDPNADRIFFWDDSAGTAAWLTVGSGLQVNGTSLENTQSGGSVTSVAGTGSVNGLTLTGTVTTAGSITLGGTLAISNTNWSGADLSLANGGTGASLADPNADRILFWDDSTGAVTWLTAGSGLAITGTTIAATSSGGTVTSVSGSGSVNGLSLTGTVTSSGDITLGGTLAINNADWSGAGLSLANGGTGASLTAPTADRIMFWDNSAGAMAFLTVGSTMAITGTTVDVSSVNLASQVTGTLPITNGGTGSTTASGALTNLGLTATATELNYTDGVTSAIQTQLNAKQATITGGATSITSSNLTVSRALVSDGSGKVAVSAVTSTEVGYLDGVTSNIQTQLNGKGVGSVTSVAVSGGTTGLTTSGGPITGSGTITLAGTLAVANGGTGSTTASGALTSLGLTATAAEINVLDGITATTTELNYTGGVTSNIQTQLNAKGVGSVTSVGGTGTVDGLTLSGTVTSSGNLTLGGSVSINNANWSGTDLSLANGGTGASLVDPNADRIFFWDDSAGATTFLTVGSGLEISGTTLSSTDAGGTVTSVGGTGTVQGLTLSGTVTSSGSLTLGGSLSDINLTSQVTGTLPVANGGTGVTSSTGTGSVVLSSAPTITSLALDGAYSEEVYALSGTALDPANGTLQTKTLAANTTFTESLTSGESMVLMLGAGASYTVTWPTITWVTSAGNVAPTLTANDTLVFWKISTTLYGAYVGSYA